MATIAHSPVRGRLRRLVAALGSTFVLAAVVGTGATAPARPNPAPAVLVMPQSMFVDNPAQGGRDPFFPKSTRRQQQANPHPTQPALGTTKITTALNLRGIVLGQHDRRMALINNQIFEAGEAKTNAFLVDGLPVTVRCLEIREDNVVVNVGGRSERFVLPLRKQTPTAGGP